MSDDPRQAPAADMFSRPADLRPLFSNVSRIRIGPGEVGFTFAYLDDIPKVGSNLTEIASVTITPTHAKRLTIHLIEWLAAYEEAFGEIPADPTQGPDQQKVSERAAARMQDWRNALRLTEAPA